jgi:polysaccharide export outer membrane protein
MSDPRLLILAAAIALAGCASQGPPRNPEAYGEYPPPDKNVAVQDYQIGPGDTISVNVFQEKDLTLEHVDVDASGNVLLPLVGSVHAAGLSATQLAKELEDRLAKRYLRDPQVSVIVLSAVSQKVTVDGSVAKGGVFELKGQTTLLEAVAMAQGPNRTADLGHVVIFRNINGQRHYAAFDLNAIRKGKTPDPQIRGDDVVVVPFSGSKGAFRDAISALPALGAFAVFGGL